MEWISQNWVWILFAVAMIAMHMFGHGGHGGHGSHRGEDHDGTKPAKPNDMAHASKQRSGHQR